MAQCTSAGPPFVACHHHPGEGREGLMNNNDNGKGNAIGLLLLLHAGSVSGRGSRSELKSRFFLKNTRNCPEFLRRIYGPDSRKLYGNFLCSSGLSFWQSAFLPGAGKFSHEYKLRMAENGEREISSLQLQKGVAQEQTLFIQLRDCLVDRVSFVSLRLRGPQFWA